MTLAKNYGGAPGCRRWAKSRHKSEIPPELAREILRQLITQWGTAQPDSIPPSSGMTNYARIFGVPIETVLDTGSTRMLITEGTIAYLQRTIQS